MPNRRHPPFLQLQPARRTLPSSCPDELHFEKLSAAGQRPAGEVDRSHLQGKVGYLIRLLRHQGSWPSCIASLEVLCRGNKPQSRLWGTKTSWASARLSASKAWSRLCPRVGRPSAAGIDPSNPDVCQLSCWQHHKPDEKYKGG